MTIAARTCSTTTPGEADPIFDSCVPPNKYQSLHYHRPESRREGKSRWSLTRDDECHTFCVATDRGWADRRGKRWYVSPDAREIGTNGEQVAIYTQSGANIPWHGYPVSARPDAVQQTVVPPEILKTWGAENATTRGLIKRLWKRRS